MSQPAHTNIFFRYRKYDKIPGVKEQKKKYPEQRKIIIKNGGMKKKNPNEKAFKNKTEK